MSGNTATDSYFTVETGPGCPLNGVARDSSEFRVVLAGLRGESPGDSLVMVDLKDPRNLHAELVRKGLDRGDVVEAFLECPCKDSCVTARVGREACEATLRLGIQPEK